MGTEGEGKGSCEGSGGPRGGRLKHPPPPNSEGPPKYTILRISYILTFYYTIITSTSANTGCPRKNVPDFGRVFLMLKYTDITQNTYVQS